VFRPGTEESSFTDVAGLKVRSQQRMRSVRPALTALLCGPAGRAAVDVRGGGPGTRETERAFAPKNLVGRGEHWVLAGGSKSLDWARCRWRRPRGSQAKGLGLQMAFKVHPPIPIVP